MFIDVLVSYIKKYSILPVHKSVMVLVNNTIKMLKQQMKEYTIDGAVVPKDLENIFENQILFSIVWGIACAVEESSRKNLSDFLLKMIRATPDII